MGNPNSTKLASLKHVVLLGLSLIFAYFDILRKTKLPANAKKSQCRQSCKAAVSPEMFGHHMFGFLMSPQDIV